MDKEYRHVPGWLELNKAEEANRPNYIDQLLIRTNDMRLAAVKLGTLNARFVSTIKVPKEQVKECTDKFSKQRPARTTMMDLSIQEYTDTLASANDDR